jgi:hypothetical protein
VPFLLKINKNNLFTPTVLIFLSFILYTFTNQNLAERNYQYSYILVISGIFLLTKVFVISFAQIDKYFSQKKWILLSIDIVLTGIQFAFAFLAVQNLANDKFPDFTVQFFLISNIFFCIQLFLGKIQGLIKMLIAIFIIYIPSLLILNRKIFFDNNAVLTQQTIAYLILILEVCLFLVITRYFVSKGK